MDSDTLPEMGDEDAATAMPKILYMIVEHFRNGDAAPVYRRFRERGRMAPDGLVYVASWGSKDAAEKIAPRL